MAFQKIVLPYSFAALEPYFDAQTMEIHYGKHHQAYTDKLNAALEKYPEYYDWKAEDLLRKLKELPEDIQTPVKNHAGGLVNHNIFFSSLMLNKEGKPSGKLAEEINKTWGNFDKFKAEFTAQATALFGSGWTWLAADENGENLHIHNHPNQENPYLHNHIPLLGLDVWEHAYYLKYQNRRPEYIEAFWNVINWEKIEKILG